MFPIKQSSEIADLDDAMTGASSAGSRRDNSNIRRGGPVPGTSGRRMQQMEQQHNQYRSDPGRSGSVARQQKPTSIRRSSTEAPWIGEYTGHSQSLSSLRNTKTTSSSSRALLGGLRGSPNEEEERKMSIVNEEIEPAMLIGIEDSNDTEDYNGEEKIGSRSILVRKENETESEPESEAAPVSSDDSPYPPSTHKSTGTSLTEDLSHLPSTAVEKDYCDPLNNLDEENFGDVEECVEADYLAPLNDAGLTAVPKTHDDYMYNESKGSVPRELSAPRRRSSLNNSGHSIGDISCLSVECVADDEDDRERMQGFSTGPPSIRSSKLRVLERLSSNGTDLSDGATPDPGSFYTAVAEEQHSSSQQMIDEPRRRSQGGGGFIDGIPIDAYDGGSNDSYYDGSDNECGYGDHFGDGHDHKKMKVTSSARPASRRPTLANLVDSVTAKAGPTINRARRAVASSIIADGNAGGGYGPSNNRYGPPSSSAYEPDPTDHDVRGAVGGAYGRINDAEMGTESGECNDGASNENRERKRRSTTADVMTFLSGLSDDYGIGRASSKTRKSIVRGGNRIVGSTQRNRSTRSTGQTTNETPEERTMRRRSTAEALEGFLAVLDTGLLGEIDEIDAVSLMHTIEELNNEEEEEKTTNDENNIGKATQKEAASQNAPDDKSCQRSVAFADEVSAEPEPPDHTTSKKTRRRSTAEALEAFLKVIDSGALGYVDNLDVQSLCNDIDEIRNGEESVVHDDENGNDDSGDEEQHEKEEPTEKRAKRRGVAKRRSTIELLEKAKARAQAHQEKPASKPKPSNRLGVAGASDSDGRRGSEYSIASDILVRLGARLDEEEAQSLMNWDEEDDEISLRRTKKYRDPIDHRESLDHVRALVQHVLKGDRSSGTEQRRKSISDDGSDAASREEEALREVRRRYTLYLLEKAKSRVDLQEEFDSKSSGRRKTLSRLGLTNGLFDEESDSLMETDGNGHGTWGWDDFKIEGHKFCGFKPVMMLAAVALVLVLIPVFSWVRSSNDVNTWTFSTADVPLQPYDALNPADAYESAHEGLEQILIEVDNDDDEDALLAIAEEARNMHLKVPKTGGGSIYAIESSRIGKKLLANLPNTRIVDTDFTIQAVEDIEQDEHIRSLSLEGHALGDQEKMGHGIAEIWEGCEPPTPSQKVGVCIADTGVACGHPDLPPRSEISGEDMSVDNGAYTYEYCDDKNGHGSHMAGVVAALRGNGRGIVGGATNAAKLIATRALRDDKRGSYGTMMDAIEGCKRNGAKIIVLSLGCQKCPNEVAHDYIRDTVEKDGIMVFAAAGNFGSPEPFYPASFREAISVTATNRHAGRWGLSNYGDQIELGCLGYSVLSTDVEAETDHLGNVVGVKHTYKTRSGTSMAAPCVAAAAAAVWGVDPTCTNQEIRNVLALTAKHPNGRCDTELGFGIVQPCKAIEHINKYGCKRTPGNWILSEDDAVCSAAESFVFQGDPIHTPGAGHHPESDESDPIGRSPENPSNALEEQLNQLQREYNELKKEVEEREPISFTPSVTKKCRDHPRKKVRIPGALRKGRKKKGRCSAIAKAAATEFPGTEERDQVLQKWCRSRVVSKFCKKTCRKCPTID